MSIPDHLLEQIDNLEPLSVTSRRLMEILGDEDVALREIVEILENDEAVAANVLRAANSAGLGGRYQIDNLNTAAARLGVDQLIQVAVGDHLQGLQRDTGVYELGENELWLHSAVTAVAAREIVQLHDDQDFGPATCIAALVHDIGKLVMIRTPEADPAELRACWDNAEGRTFLEFERELFGCDHTEVGAALAERWSFPPGVTEVIARHHETSAEVSSPMLDAVKVANFVSKTAGVGLGAEGLNVALDSEAFERLGIDEDSFSLICVETATRATQLREEFQPA